MWWFMAAAFVAKFNFAGISLICSASQFLLQRQICLKKTNNKQHPGSLFIHENILLI